VQGFASQHAGRVFTGSQALGVFKRQLPIRGRFARMDVKAIAHSVEQLIGPHEITTDGSANPSPDFPVRLVLFEKSVETQRVLDLSGRQIEDFRDFHNRRQWHMP
jgi:hypothetical protein